MAYSDIYAGWKADPEGFWLEAARGIDWDRAPSRALDDSKAPLYEWFTDAEVNTCWNAVDRHVLAGRGDQIAIIHDSPVTHTKHTITYAELQTRVASLAGALRAKGVEKGDRVIIYMPMIPEALEAMLACARLGAIHSVVFGGFAAAELAVRIDDCKPRAIIAASCGIEPDAGGSLQTASGWRHRSGRSQAGFLRDLSARTRGGQTGRRPRCCLAHIPVWRQARRLCAGQGQSPRLYPLHLRHHRRAQGCGAAHGGASGGAELVDARGL